jgi:hypothetical protein
MDCICTAVESSFDHGVLPVWDLSWSSDRSTPGAVAAIPFLAATAAQLAAATAAPFAVKFKNPRRARERLVVPEEVVAFRWFITPRLLPDRHAGNSIAQTLSAEIMRAALRCDRGIPIYVPLFKVGFC